jgi:pyruvate formate lyase activating enzyme
MDAANVDLKGFSENFYHGLTKGHLEPVLETLRYLRRERRTWLEITTLLIPGENDGDAELHALAAWMREELGPEVPLHFSAFHPDYRMRDKPRTPHETLIRARRIALAEGVHHVYVGNVLDPGRSSTYCSACGQRLIGRRGYELTEWQLDAAGKCRVCGTPCPGVFPEPPGNWGGRRQVVRLSQGNNSGKKEIGSA